MSDRWITNPDGSKRRRQGGAPAVASAETGYETPKSHAAADKQAKERGITFPSNVKTVKDKASFLASV